MKSKAESIDSYRFMSDDEPTEIQLGLLMKEVAIDMTGFDSENLQAVFDTMPKVSNFRIGELVAEKINQVLTDMMNESKEEDIKLAYKNAIKKRGFA